MSPSQVILPVACRLPVTVVSEFKLITPMPVAVILIGSLLTVFEITLSRKTKLAVLIAGVTIVGVLL